MRKSVFLAAAALCIAAAFGGAGTVRADDDDYEINKVRFALACGAKFGAVEEASATERGVGGDGGVILRGVYRQRFGLGMKLGPFSQSEGSEYSGVFVAEFDKSRRLRRLQWKIGVRGGETPAACLG